jgi:MFS family permease
MTAHETPEDLRERPIGDLVKQLAGQTSTLVRQEIDLAKAEIAGKGAGMLSGAAVVGLLAAGSLTAFVILLLSEAMDAWVAALIVAVVLGAVAAVLALTGRNRIRTATPAVPEQTMETVKEDMEWAKTRTPSGRA